MNKNLYSLFTPVLALTLTAVSLTSCQDPYPTSGVITQKPRYLTQLMPSYVIDSNRVMECSEGQTCEFEIRVTVPPPGVAYVDFQGLPDGAVYDDTTHKITWTPAYDVINTGKNPNQRVFTFHSTALLQSSLDPVTALREEIAFVVKDVARMANVSVVSGGSTVVEGETLTVKVKVESDDFDAASLNVSTTLGPEGLKVARDKLDPSVFVLTYSPGYNTIKFPEFNTSIDRTKTVEFDFNVFGPNGKLGGKKFTWTIADQRLAPFMSAPSTVTQGLDAGFMLRVEDSNGEAQPSVEVEYADVESGEFVLETIKKDNGNDGLGFARPSTLYMVKWDGLTEADYGKSGEVTVKACVRSSTWSAEKDLCSRTHTKVEIVKAVRTAQLLVLSPEKEVKEGESLDVRFQVINGSFDARAVSAVLEDAPEGTVVKRDSADPSIFHLLYSPNHMTVELGDITDDGTNARDFTFRVRLLGPTGTLNETEFTWRVVDQREAPHVTAPTAITQGLDVNFTVRTEDLNGEEIPTLMVNQAVPFGSLEITLIDQWAGIPGIALPSSLYNVKWVGLTEANYGRTANINFAACTSSAPGLLTNCKNAMTKVTIQRNTDNGATP